MHNIKDLRKNLDNFKKKLHDRNFELKTDIFENLDKTNRKLISQKEKLEEEKGILSKSKEKSNFEKSKKISVEISKISKDQIDIQKKTPLLDGVPTGSFFYFVHSYYITTENADECIATTNYGLDYTSVAGRNGLYGVQFHPEKSQGRGLQILKNFAQMS
mgnify:CR=1 FL=1